MLKIMASGLDNYTDNQYGRFAPQEEYSTYTPITENDTVNATQIPSDKNWAALGVLPIIIFVAMGNILVILAVKMDHKLRSSTNYFLTSLALADLLVALTVMPPSLAMIVNNYKWPFPEGMCGIWIMLDVCFSTSSILHLCMISLDRYLALAKPFQYSGGRLSKSSSSAGWSTDKRGHSRWRSGSTLGGGSGNMTKRVAKRIILVWATSLGIALPLPILGAQNRNKIFIGEACVINIPEFTIYGSLVAFFLPLIIMFITYSLTIRTLQKQSKLVKAVMGKDGSTHRGRPSLSPSMTSRSKMPSRSSVGSMKSLTGKRISSGTTDGSLPDIFCANESRSNAAKHHRRNDSRSSGISFKVTYTEGKIKTCALMCCVCIGSNQETIEEKEMESGLINSEYDEKGRNTLQKSESDTSETSSLNQPTVTRSPMLTRANMKLAKVVSKLPLNRVSTRRMSASYKSRAIATEQRASKVLGMIFILFCIFWCPFFITNAFSGMCECYHIECNMELMGNLMNWFVWIGYVSSGVNPCVYTLFSKQFRETFRKLMSCQCSEIGLGRFYRSYPRDGTTGFSTSSFRPDVQYSMDSRDAYRNDSLVRNTLTVRQSADRPYRTFGESVLVRQHRRTHQVTRSEDIGALPITQENEEANSVKAASSAVDKLQWRSTWHCMLDTEDKESKVGVETTKLVRARRNSELKLGGRQWSNYNPRKRLLSEPNTSLKARLQLQDSIAEDDSDEEGDTMRSCTKKAGNGPSFRHGQSNVPRRQSSLDAITHDIRRAKFRCGSTDEEDNENNNFEEVFIKNDDEKRSTSPSPNGVGSQQNGRCKACGAHMSHARQQQNEQDNNSDDVFKTDVNSSERFCVNSNPRTKLDGTTCSDSRLRRHQLSRLDSGVGASVRNSDSY